MFLFIVDVGYYMLDSDSSYYLLLLSNILGYLHSLFGALHSLFMALYSLSGLCIVFWGFVLSFD